MMIDDKEKKKAVVATSRWRRVAHGLLWQLEGGEERWEWEWRKARRRRKEEGGRDSS